MKFTPEKFKELNIKFERYIKETTIPIVCEFAYKNNMSKQQLYEHDEFADSIKKCITKKEANLERGALTGQINHGMAIFSLKQLGWKDQNNILISGEMNINDMSDKQLDNRIAKIEKLLKIKKK